MTRESKTEFGYADDEVHFSFVIFSGAYDEHVDLKAFASLRDKLKVVAVSPESSYNEG